MRLSIEQRRYSRELKCDLLLFKANKFCSVGKIIKPKHTNKVLQSDCLIFFRDYDRCAYIVSRKSIRSNENHAISRQGSFDLLYFENKETKTIASLFRDDVKVAADCLCEKHCCLINCSLVFLTLFVRLHRN